MTSVANQAPVALDLDHVGVAVRRLDAGRDALLRLGFRLTPRSQHRGARTPGGPVEEWGSANHCAMLRQGYIELAGLTDPSKFSNVRSLVEKYEGTHIVALEPKTAEAAHAELTARGVPVDAPRDLERMAAYGPDERDSRRVAFRNLYLAPSAFTEARLIYTEHLTRDVMWQPHLMEHANGALRLRDLFLCAPEPEVTAKKLAPAFGVDPAATADGEHVLRFANSAVRVLSPAAWSKWAPGAKLPPLPAPVGLGLQVASWGATQDFFRRQDFSVNACPTGGIWIGPDQACGTVMHFSE
ncbi:MAG TPA: VOC family protein [Alphaproteobacteria bacterium]